MDHLVGLLSGLVFFGSNSGCLRDLKGLLSGLVLFGFVSGLNAKSAMESLTECPSPASSQSNSVGLLSREKSDVRGNSEESPSDMSGGERLT